MVKIYNIMIGNASHIYFIIHLNVKYLDGEYGGEHGDGEYLDGESTI